MFIPKDYIKQSSVVKIKNIPSEIPQSGGVGRVECKQIVLLGCFRKQIKAVMERKNKEKNMKTSRKTVQSIHARSSNIDNIMDHSKRSTQ